MLTLTRIIFFFGIVLFWSSVTLPTRGGDIHKNGEDILLYLEEVADENKTFIGADYSVSTHANESLNRDLSHEDPANKSSSASQSRSPQSTRGTIKSLKDYLEKKSIPEVGLQKLNIVTNQRYQRPYYSGHHVTSNDDIKVGEVLFAVPLEDSFSVTNMDKVIITGIENIARQIGDPDALAVMDVPFDSQTSASREEVRKTLLAPFTEKRENNDYREFGLLYYTIIGLVSERRRVEETMKSQTNDAKNNSLPSSKWSRFVKSLSSMGKVKHNHGLFLTVEERRACLPPSLKQVLSYMEDDIDRIIDITSSLCLTPMTVDRRLQETQGMGKDDVEMLSRLTMKERFAVVTRKFLCDVKREELIWGYAVIHGRSHKVSDAPILFPIIDSIPYAAMSNLRPGNIREVTPSNNVNTFGTTPDSAPFSHNEKKNNNRVLIAEIVAAKDIRRGEPLTFRIDVRDPLEVMLSLGYFETNFYFRDSDGIPLETIFSQMFESAGTEEEITREMEESPRFGALKCTTDPKSWSIPFGYRVLNKTDPFDAFHPQMIRCIQMIAIKNVTGLTGAELADFREKYQDLYYSSEEGVQSSYDKAGENPGNHFAIGTLSSKTMDELVKWTQGVHKQTINVLQYSLGVSKQLFEYHQRRCVSLKRQREFLKEIAYFHSIAGWTISNALDHLDDSILSGGDQDNNDNKTQHNLTGNRKDDGVVETDL